MGEIEVVAELMTDGHGVTAISPVEGQTGLVIAVPEDAEIDVYYWKPGMTEVAKGNMIVSNGMVSDQKFRGSLFTNAPSKTEARVYKIESIAFSEESFVEISATFTPLNSDGTMKLLDWDSKDFKIEENR